MDPFALPDATTLVLLCVAAAMAGWVDAVSGGGGLLQLPALFLAVFAWFYYPDRPGDARWLDPAERQWLLDNVHAEVRKDAGADRAGRWDAARTQIDSMRDRQLAAFARAELFLAANSPRVEGSDLRTLLNEAPNLPQAARLLSLAQRRGVNDLPNLPGQQCPQTGQSADRLSG